MITGKVGFTQLKIECLIGIHPHEIREPQPLLIDLTATADLSHAIRSDEIEDCFDYEQMANFCRSFGEKHHYHLLEKFTYQLLKGLMKEFQLSEATIKISKPQALPKCSAAFIELTLTS